MSSSCLTAAGSRRAKAMTVLPFCDELLTRCWLVAQRVSDRASRVVSAGSTPTPVTTVAATSTAPVVDDSNKDAAHEAAFAAQDANQLKSVYDQIRTAVGYNQQITELTVWFTGLGILAVSAALIWSQRLI